MDVEFLYNDAEFSGSSDYDYRTDCINSHQMNGLVEAAVPRLGELSLSSINIEESGAYTIRRVSDNGHIFESTIDVTGTYVRDNWSL